MLKTIDIVLVCAMLAAASWTYKIKHDAALVEDEIARVERQIALEKETIALLEADWSLLDQPNRLQRLAEAFGEELKLTVPRPDQVVEIDGLPAPPPPPPPEEGEEPTIRAAVDLDAEPESTVR